MIFLCLLLTPSGLYNASAFTVPIYNATHPYPPPTIRFVTSQQSMPLHCPVSVLCQYLWGQAPLKFQVQIYLELKINNLMWSFLYFTHVLLIYEE